MATKPKSKAAMQAAINAVAASGGGTPNPKIVVNKNVAGEFNPKFGGIANPKISVAKNVAGDYNLGAPNVRDPRGAGRAAVQSSGLKPVSVNKNNKAAAAKKAAAKKASVEDPALPPTGGGTTSTVPQPTKDLYMNKDWSKVVGHYFPETTYKNGGLVRGGGAAQKGRGRGKII